jgi:hypothetical protein
VALFEEEQVSHDKDLLLGDEPLQGAEDLKNKRLWRDCPEGRARNAFSGGRPSRGSASRPSHSPQIQEARCP